MSRQIAALLLGSALVVGSNAPAMAMDGDTVAKSIASTTMRLVFWSAGTVLGTPIAVLRKTGENTMETFNKGDGGMQKAGYAAAALPVGVVTGSLEGLWLGPKNSWEASGEHPFSKDLVSLGEMKD